MKSMKWCFSALFYVIVAVLAWGCSSRNDGSNHPVAAGSGGGVGGSSGIGGIDGSAGTDSGQGGSSGQTGDAGGDGCWTQLAAGFSHTCARKQDGSLWCWGSNYYGQLGDGTMDGLTCGSGTYKCKPSPVQVTGLGSVIEVVAGGWHTCARKQDETLWCWGSNSDRQLGDASPEWSKPSPVQVTGLGPVTQVAAGGDHTCARKTDGMLWCWGANNRGQVAGDGTTTPKSSPVQVTGLGPVTQVAAGGDHTCARKTDGTLWCWGDNDDGQVGDGTTVWSKPSPVQVAGLGPVTEVAASFSHTCARKQDGSLWCWGRNSSGQLGDGTMTGQLCLNGLSCKPSPVQVTSLDTAVVAVAAGAEHTCARKQDGTLWCWGGNDYGQLGDGTVDGQACGSYKYKCQPSPVQVTGLGPVTQVAAGGDHTCARKQDGSLWCWGDNSSGQLGDGQLCLKGFPCKPSPVKVIGGDCP